MATINEIGQEYVSRIVNAKNKKQELNEVFKEIDNLAYTNNQPISKEDKVKLLEAV